ncbi:MAG: shikimate dehydrogenase [Firmicutes bacterium]|nr:shikimate dehydrogenase [Bacillota bacterium]
MASAVGTRLVGLIGYPVGHTASPAMHQAGFRALGLDWFYVPMEVPPGLVGDAVRGLRALGFAGANVTIPHKQAVLGHVDRLTSEARRVGAVNTLWIDGGRIVGHNTDVAGFRQAVARALPDLDGRVALSLGAGGAARAAIAACVGAPCERVVVAARRLEAARELARAFGRVEAVALEATSLHPLLESVDLLVNATPLGMAGVGQGEALVELAPPARLAPGAVVMDMVYRPLDTPLLQAARQAGRAVVTGAAMLLHQGTAAFELWTGRPAPVTAMARALARELGVQEPDEAGLPTPPQPKHAG